MDSNSINMSKYNSDSGRENFQLFSFQQPVQNESNAQIQEESIMSNNLDQLQTELVTVFEMYCNLGDPLNSQFMSLNKFCKMIMNVKENSQDNQNLNEINMPDVELIFAKAANYGNQTNLESNINVINFSQFMFALELIAMKVYRYSANAISYLIKDHILPLKDYINEEVTASSEHIIQLMEILKDEEMVNLLELIHKTLYPYYTFYCNEQNLMTLDSFIDFCQDFRIFPDILPDELVIQFFKTLSNFY